MADQAKSETIEIPKWLLPPLSVVLCLLMIEGGLRLLKAPASSLNHVPCITEADEQFGYKFKPYASGLLRQNFEIETTVRTNALGFHDIDHDFSPDIEHVRIVAVGDSFTAASQVPVAQGWTQTAERELGGVDIINLGMDGSGTNMHLALLQHYVPRLQPDLVILAFFENDFSDVLLGITLDCYADHLLIFQDEAQKMQLINFLETHSPSPTSYALAQKSYLYRTAMPILFKGGFLLRTNLLAPGLIGVSVLPPKEVEPGFFDDLFREMIALSGQYHFTLLVIPVPGREDPAGSMAVLQDMIAKEVLSQVTVINVYPAMSGRLAADSKEHYNMYFVHDEHFNEYGYRLFGEVVAQAIAPYLKENVTNITGSAGTESR